MPRAERVLTRRGLLQAGTVAAAAGVPLRRGRAATKTTLRFSYQLSSALLLILREHGTLDERLGPLGFAVEWSRLNNDAMRTGAVDFHSDVAEAVPLFTQAANPTLTLYAAEGPSPRAVALIVPADSPVHDLADLRGRRIATSKGSASHCLVMKALARAGLGSHDVQIAFLDAPDGAAAFQANGIDAWAVYDPYLALTEVGRAVRSLTDGAAMGMRYDRYYLVNAAMVAQHGEVVQTVFTALQDAAHWLGANAAAADALLARLWGNVPLDTVRRVNSRRVYDVRAIGTVDRANLQSLSETFRQAGVIRDAQDTAAIPAWDPRPA